MAKTQEAARTSKGTCNFCGGTFDKGKMTQHLKFCKQRAAVLKAANETDTQKMKLFHLVVEGRDLPMYWMHLEMPADATLADMDDFLRDTWLECCGHLSEFRIGKTSYMSQTEEMMWDFGNATEVQDEEDAEEEEALAEDEEEVEEDELSPLDAITMIVERLNAELGPDLTSVPASEIEAKLTEILNTEAEAAHVSLPPEVLPEIGRLAQLLQSGLFASLIEDPYQERDMGVELGAVLKVGQKIPYEYDFGSTTDLMVRVVGEREGALTEEEQEEVVHVMARNEAPVISCRECGKPATKVISGYFYAGDGALCDACAKKNREDEEMMLPVVNSPRVGVCAYTGESDGVEWDEEEWEEMDEDEEDDEDDEEEK
jgi:hypothetical protein